jgi:hypothetical protein
MVGKLAVIILTGMCVMVSGASSARDCSRSLSSGERDPIIEKWTEEALGFIDDIWQAARMQGLSDQDRKKRYEASAQKLVRTARDLKMDTEPLLVLARECVEHEESTRSPLPGWDPNDKAGNLSLFSQAAQRIVQIHLQLLGYARKYCR